MANKDDAVIKIKKITFLCNSKEFEVDADNVGYSAVSTPCEMCGSHGAVTISLVAKCPICGKYHSIEIESW